METPKTYYGYDSNNNHICTVTAENADNWINPQEVNSALKNIDTVLTDGINKIVSAMEKVETRDTIIIQGTKMDGKIEEVCEAIKQIPTGIINNLNEYQKAAEEAHEYIQQQLNIEANNTAWDYVNQQGGGTVQ